MSTGYIYKIWSLQSDEIYIGSTQCVRRRKNGHKRSCNITTNKKHNYRVYQHIRAHGGWDAWFMNVVEQVEYTHRWELETREAHHIKTLKASLNCIIPGRTQAEWYQDHREAILQRVKQYSESNREAIAEKNKRYRERKNQKIECCCGLTSVRNHLKRHQKTKKHHEAFSRKTYDFIWS